MFKYERLTHTQIQNNLESGIKQVLLNIMPLDFCHCIATGCGMGWFVEKDDERHLVIRPLFRCIVLKSDKTKTVVVYEERPDALGGPRAVAFDYCGPKPYDGSSGGPLMSPNKPESCGFDPPQEWDGT